MNLHTKMDSLCRELSIVLPPPDVHGAYTLQFDAQFSVGFFYDKSRDILLSEGFKVPSERHILWSCVEKAMRISYAWPGLSTHLAFDDECHLQVQSFIPQDASYESFFEITSAHCSLCEFLLKELNQPIVKAFDYHACITP